VSWLRLDDGVMLNPKVGELTDSEFRSLLGLWSYCARRKNEGRFKADEMQWAIYVTSKGPANVLQSHLQRFIEVGLIVPRGGKSNLYEVKDWAHYQPKDPTAAERQKRYRDRNAERNATVTEALPRARASRPVPSLEISTNSSELQQPAREPTEAEVVRAREEREQRGYVENLSSYTGCRYIRGSHALTAIHDVLGTEHPPNDWPYPRPTREEVSAALKQRKHAHA
jgi:hypothetical protein